MGYGVVGFKKGVNVYCLTRLEEDICHQHLATMHTYSLFKTDVDGGCSGGDRKNSFWGKSCVWQTKIMNKRLFVRKFGHKGTGKYIHISVICSFSQPLHCLK